MLLRACSETKKPPGAKAADAAHLSKPVIRIADEGALRSAGRGRPMVRIETYRPSRARVCVPRRKRGRPDIYLASTFDDEEPELIALARAIRLRSRRR